MAKMDFALTPFGTVTYISVDPARVKTNDKGKADFVVSLKLDEADLAAWRKKMADFWGNRASKAKKPKLGVAVTSDGEILIRAKSQYAPALFDMKNGKVDPATRIGNGSIVRLNVGINAYDRDGKNGEPPTSGISLVLNQVQIKKLVEWESKGDTSAFDEGGDGYVAYNSSSFGADEPEEEATSTGSALDI